MSNSLDVPQMTGTNTYRSQRDALQRLKAEVNDLEKERRDKQNQVTRCGQAIGGHQKQRNRLLIDLQRAETIVVDLQDALDRDAIEEGRLDALTAYLAEARSELTTHEGSYEDSVIAIDKATERMNSCRHQMTEIDTRIAEAEAKVLKAESKAVSLEIQRMTALQAKNKTVQTIEDERRRKQDKEQERQQKVATVKDFVEQASAICARVSVDPGENCTSIDHKLSKLVADLKKYENRIGGNKQQIAESAAAAANAFAQAKKQVKEIEQLGQVRPRAISCVLPSLIWMIGPQTNTRQPQRTVDIFPESHYSTCPTSIPVLTE